MTRAMLLGLAILALMIGQGAQASEKPILLLDPGGHMALIRTVLFAPDGKHLISAADDKVIRIWDLEKGLTVRMLRGQIGEGSRGKIYAIALSPDGSLLAAGGRMREAGEGSHPIRLYDFESGEIVALLDGHQGAVLSLAFSPDGRHLVSGSTDDTAIIWDVEQRRLLRPLRGHKADINRAVFTRDGARVVTGSDDRTLGLWSVQDGSMIARSTLHAGKVFGVAISPATGEVASATQQGEVRLSDDKSLRQIRKFVGAKGDLLGLSFSDDGKRLISGAGTPPYRCRVWDVRSGRVLRTYAGHDHLVIAIDTNNDLVATAGGSNNEIHIWNMDTGKVAKILRGVGQSVWSVGFSPDGSALAWGHTRRQDQLNDQGPLEYGLRLPKEDRTTGDPRKLSGDTESFRRAVDHSRAMRLVHKSGGDYGYYAHLNIVHQGKVRAVIRRDENSGFAHNAYTFTPDAAELITGGGNGWLTAFDATGRKRGDFIGHTSDVWAVAASPDGRLVLSGSDDQTVRLWNFQTLENIVSLFYGRNGEWIIWTPQGYYAASPTGDQHVGWHINEGEAKAARLVTAAQLKRHFYRPDIIRRALEHASALRAIEEAQNTDFALNELPTRRPPAFSIVSPKDGSKVGQSPTDLILHVSANPESIEGYDITVNGRRVVSKTDGSPSGQNLDNHEVNFQIPLSAGQNHIEIVAYNALGTTTQETTVEHTGQPDLDKRGTLYMVAIGVDKYPNLEGEDLDFAEADAMSFNEMIANRTGPLHRATKIQLLATQDGMQPSAENIREALGALAKAGPRDTVIVYLAGHGINQGQDYLFLPTDANKNDDGKFKPASVISWQELQDALGSSRGQRILLMDTCYSGNAYNPRLIKDAADDKIAVLAATDAETLAHEVPKVGHGAFTYSLLEGLKGGAEIEKDGRIRVGELSKFVKEQVERITRNKQTPTSYFSSGRFFVLAIE